MVEVIRSHLLEGTPHGFLGRRGGVSTGLVAGLNVGLGAIGRQGDTAEAVAENRARAVAEVLPGAQLATVYQVHSALCAIATAPWPEAERPHADALVTATPGLLLGILTADCAPVLLADRTAGVVGAAHAGWKGALTGVTDTTIAGMEALGATRQNITAAIGPCIAQASYEVDEAFYARFQESAADNDRFFAKGKPGHHQFNLEAYVAHRLSSAGIRQIEQLGLDTYTAPDRFFSFRRATHLGEANYGREIALIGL